MKYATLTIVYNDEPNVRACINNWKGLVDKHLVLVSEVPWKGPRYERDNTYETAVKMGADVVLGRWQSEASQRNWGLARLYDYDYIFMFDVDEFMTREDIEKFKLFMEEQVFVPIVTCKTVKSYWKTPDYVLEPGDACRMPVALDPKAVLFTEARNSILLNGTEDSDTYLKQADVTLHHFCYVRDDVRIVSKLTSYEHAESLVVDLRDWYQNTWSKWEPGSTQLVRPQGVEPSIAVYNPAPKEITDLFNA